MKIGIVHDIHDPEASQSEVNRCYPLEYSRERRGPPVLSCRGRISGDLCVGGRVRRRGERGRRYYSRRCEYPDVFHDQRGGRVQRPLTNPP